MGLFDWFWRLFGAPPGGSSAPPDAGISPPTPQRARVVRRRRHPRPRLTPFRFRIDHARPDAADRRPDETVPERPYRFARPGITGGWLDLSRDGDPERLRQFGLPDFRTPQELAAWLNMPLGRLAWLVHRFEFNHQPADEKSAHYVYRWIAKRSGGRRLIEAPKPLLKGVQRRILNEILNQIPPHPAAHGFVGGRSTGTNAGPHLGRRVVVKLDLENFYPSVRFSRVVAIFRSLGYAREAAIWLARLTTATLPDQLTRKGAAQPELQPYLGRRLPQGAPTSPALANLSAFAADLRLAGLARCFEANFTRYADDLTFSGDERFLNSLAVFLPLVGQIVRSERFRLNKAKCKVIRNNQRQQVTGVVVNERPNVPRHEYDRLKATLTNCVRRGPSTQNHDRHDDFAGHLSGRIAYVTQLNPDRGRNLAELFRQIDWNK